MGMELKPISLVTHKDQETHAAKAVRMPIIGIKTRTHNYRHKRHMEHLLHHEMDLHGPVTKIDNNSNSSNAVS
jgi:hypothetical protein